MTSLVYSNKPDVPPMDKSLAKKISSFVAKYKLPKKKAITLFRFIRIACDHYSVFNCFDDLDVLDKKRATTAKAIVRHGGKLLEMLKQWERVCGDSKKDNTTQAQAIIKRLIRDATGAGESVEIKTSKKRRGKKIDGDKLVILRPLIIGYWVAFDRQPTISKNPNSPDKKSHFHIFFDAAWPLITGMPTKISQSTLQDYLGRWKESADGIETYKDACAVARQWYPE